MAAKTRSTLGTILILCGVLCLCAGCYGMYRSWGMTDAQATQQVKSDATVAGTVLGAAGVAAAGAATGGWAWLWPLITATIGGVGTILTGWLAKKLNVANDLNATVIAGVESAADPTTKAAIYNASLLRGNAAALHARVKRLTGSTPAPRPAANGSGPPVA